MESQGSDMPPQGSERGRSPRTVSDGSDAIRLTGLTVRGHHGVFDFEKRDGQDFVVDVVLGGDLSRPAASDDLADTIDYGTLADDLAAIIGGEPFDLIEALAGALADRCLESCADVEVTVHKPQAPIAHAFTDVAVTLRRTWEKPNARHAGTATGQDRASPQERMHAVVALGANLGDALETLQDAVRALDLHPRIRVLAGSPVYVTAPVGGIDQPDFHNAAVTVETTLSPHELLAVCQGIEVGAGRTREVRWGPRTLDLDLVSLRRADTAAEVRLDDPILTLPHPRAGERSFVLAPWADVDPDASVDTPDGPAPVAAVRDRAPDADGVRRTDRVVWPTADPEDASGPADTSDPEDTSGPADASGPAQSPGGGGG
ncbi:hypothetical protein GCM10023159_24200 [Brevibacterium yomogidense]